ncbi:MAG: cell division ATP-binding protein FtsE [Clostridiales bacterium]|nr:cell division ATP-binding protein FtsE [Eubacterium sp.]MDD7349673.1 cell division ATP-binding protein FtsE [Clostridiales bacterium]MDY3774856.1 cell division ATP-binding protein FtsE [Eubacterium sp.]
MIALDDVSKQYQTGVDALKHVTLQIKNGEFVFVVGKSGSGKSTFIKLLLKELDPTSGKLYIAGRLVNKLKRKQIPLYRRNIGVVFQDFRLLKDRTVFENIAFAQRIIGRSKREMIRNVTTMLTIVGLTDKADAYPNELSGGEQQRVAIARALVNQPTILLADEPTGNLDPQNAWEIMMLLQEVNKMGTTVVVVTHNNDIVDIMQKRVVTLNEGTVVRDDKKGGYEYERD